MERAGMVLAIALNFYLLHAIGLGTIDAAVRLRSCDRAIASRIDALSLVLSIHLSPRVVQKVPEKLMYDEGHIPLDGKPIKDGVGFDQFQKRPSANGVDDTSFQKEITARTVETG
jgi:hypothetical protein